MFEGGTINQGVALCALPLSIFTFMVQVRSAPNQESDRNLRGQDVESSWDVGSSLLESGLFFWGGVCIGVSAWMMWGCLDTLALMMNDPVALWQRKVALLLEGVGLVVLWSWWTCRRWNNSCPELVLKLHYPLSLALFALPLESVLRGFDHHLQRLSTDLACLFLDFLQLIGLDRWADAPLNVAYWDGWTLYSDRFYLIVNETCAGVNLLLSMSLYALGFAWVMKTRLSRAWLLVMYMLPLCILFNGLRVAAIFCLGHFGDQDLATGAWHEGSGYLCQLVLFILIAWLNHLFNLELKAQDDPLRADSDLDQERRSSKRDPSE